MDLALLSRPPSVRTAGHPEDPWLRGESISYYYFGYWMMGALSQIAAVPSNIAYNLAMALIPAMGAAGIFGLVVNMVRLDKARNGVAGTDGNSTDGASIGPASLNGTHKKYAIVAGIAAALFLVVAANLEGVLEFMRLNGMGSQGFYDWIRIDGLPGPMPRRPRRAGRRPTSGGGSMPAASSTPSTASTIIDNTIQEFPFFSFLLGDMHPHVMSIPFVAAFRRRIALNIYRLPSDFWLETTAARITYVYHALVGGSGCSADSPSTTSGTCPPSPPCSSPPSRSGQYRDGSDIRQSFAFALFPVGIGGHRTRRPDVLSLPVRHQRRA